MPAKKSKSKSKAKSKAKARRKSSAKGSGTPRRVKFLVGLMLILAVAGVVGVKYLRTPQGQARLLDRGIGAYYDAVQEKVDMELRGALGRFGLRRDIDARIEVVRTGGKRHRLRVWDVPCNERVDLTRVNVGLTHAARDAGARVRHTQELDGGDRLVMRVGTERYETHRVTLRTVRRVAAAPPPKPLPKVALVIDDFGYNRGNVVEALLKLDVPITVSILPTLPHSSYILGRARAMGRCTLLHLPMQPDEDGGSDIPAVTVDMGEREIAQLVAKYVDSMPGIDGVNNHQGSRATADDRVMRAVTEALGGRDLFFLDSLTSSKSVAYNVAKRSGLRTARNAVFLDADTEDAGVVEDRLRRLVARAMRDGQAIGIAHPHRWTLEALQSSREWLDDAGVELVYVSELVH